MSAQPRMQARIPYDYRQAYFKIISTTHVGTWISDSHGICVAANNDGLTTRLPTMTPDQAEDFGRALIEAAEQGRALAAAAATPAPAPASTK